MLGPDNIDSYLKSEITQRKRKSGATKLQDEKLENDAFDPHAPAFDKDGNIKNEEDPKLANHSMSGIRYVLTSIVKKPNIVIPTPSSPLKPYYGDKDLAF